ncbi:MAG: hypothetical protein JW874_13600 [Spirochaetales bacterium]|nr:hypothetical protein [Spirochaetales bacterium]
MKPLHYQDKKFRKLLDALSFPPTEDGMLSKKAAKAWQTLDSLGEAAVPAMTDALGKTELPAGAVGTLVYMLAKQKSSATAATIAHQLSNPADSVRYEAIVALQGFSPDLLSAPEVRDAIVKACEDEKPDVGRVAKEICIAHGISGKGVPAWHEGTAGWESLAKAFIQFELRKDAPDYKTFRGKLRGCRNDECHGAWIRVAQEITASKPEEKMRAYLEALEFDPDPASVAWDWLNGHYDSRLRIISADAPRTIETVKEALKKLSL